MEYKNYRRMLVTNSMLAADRDIMKRFIWQKTYPDGDTFIWANGGDGLLMVSVTPWVMIPELASS